MIIRILFVIIVLLAGVAFVEARAEPMAEQWCIPGERISLQGTAEPLHELLLRWQDRAVGGGLSAADGTYRLALMVGAEQPGRYTVAVETRRDHQVVRELVCVVPPAEWLQPTSARATGTALPPVPTAEPTATRIGVTVAPLPTNQVAQTVTPVPGTIIGNEVSPRWWPCDEGQIKGNRNSMIYHLPDGDFYARTFDDVACFDTTAEAEAAGFRASER